MYIYYACIVFIFGLVMGSFLNVVGLRLPKNLSIVYPDSFCYDCNHKLKWYELIPLFSYIIQGGKCRNCKTKLSLFYPAIELLAGLLFLMSYLKFDFSNEFYISIILSCYFIIVVVSDINYMIISDEVTVFFSVLMTAVNFILFGFVDGIYIAISGLLLFIAMYLIMLVGNKIFKKETLGGGDVKLMFFVGLIVSPLYGLIGLFFASVLALPVSLIVAIKNKSTMIPFGPFILIGTFVMFYFGDIIADFIIML